MQLMEIFRDAVSDIRIVAEGHAAGLKIAARRADPNFARGTYERPLQNAIASNLSPGDVFYDIGANIGFFSLIAARCAGLRGHVYAFEPVPDNAAAIARCAHLNDLATIDVFPEAVGATTSRAELLLAHHIGGASLDFLAPPPDLRGRISVDVVAIDDIVVRRSLRPPTLVKIDVEGAELSVLRGMTRTLHAHRPLVIYEVDAETREALDSKAADIATFMDAAGYAISSLPNSYPDISWHVEHVLAQPKHLSRTMSGAR